MHQLLCGYFFGGREAFEGERGGTVLGGKGYFYTYFLLGGEGEAFEGERGGTVLGGKGYFYTFFFGVG